MGKDTAIAWTDHTSNAWIGCTRVGPGCDNCYAETLDRNRFSKTLGGGTKEIPIVHWGAGAPRYARLEAWVRDIRKFERAAAAAMVRRRVFVNSLSDFFDNEVPQAWRNEAFDVMAECSWLDFQLLTKRIGNVKNMIPVRWSERALPRNIHLGATVVNQEEADRDIPKLLAIRAWVLFLSIEPMLERIAIPGFNASTSWCPICRAIVSDSIGVPHELTHRDINFREDFDPAKHCVDVPSRLNWVICGGESGTKARPFNLAWARDLRDQCKATGTAFFMKQMGANPYWGSSEPIPDPLWVDSHGRDGDPNGVKLAGFIDRAGADPTEWPADLRIQEFPA